MALIHKLECSGCRRHLCDVMPIHHRPLEDEVSVVALCPFCGDKSFPITLPCKYFIRGSVVDDSAMPDGYREVTDLVSVTESDDQKLVTIKVKPCSN